MKNKTKKILAGACLGLVGMGCLTGCAMNDDQKAALDLITEKSDEIVALLEENMQLTNSKLSKQEAYEKIMLAINKLTVGMLDQVHISETYKEYSGVFDSEEENEIFNMYYKKDGNKKVLATVEDGEINLINISTFGTNATHYGWKKGDSSMSEREYSHSDFLISRYDISEECGLDEITADDIYDIVVNEDTYEFKVFFKNGVETGLMEIIVSKDGYLLQNKYIGLELNNGHENVRYNGYISEVKYEYENIDFTAIDEKIAELQN